MRATNLIAALVLLALSLGVLFGTRELPYWSDFAPGSAFAAFWVGAVGVVLALALFVATAMDSSHRPHEFPDRHGLIRVVALLAGLWLMILLIPHLGFLPAAILFCLFLLLGIERRPLVPSLVTTAAVAGLVYGVFIAWLGIALPTGMFGI
ncbi:tripartite tricarboxylate transporter TctB family protein [Ancylobacter sp. MQZ15Z-1]|uniref:Tripartite tricarboxylate transporter TctB family protein n=1 Tax=Ancylobacter mangrovi TaxID=2972472 RepID=A0A9X2PCN2_9HYPH|nr:tripartite tricarboxylate transporter TctB family protein [Ancylobacter mangrovi]MCS0496289.1 tripartite tricarboxylate transporter TctB family protein [Ancylobacter mangrovi]